MHRYTPILLLKQGELKALELLRISDKHQIVPLIQLLPDKKENRVGNYINDRLKPITQGWTFQDNRIYIDPYFLNDPNQIILFWETLLRNGVNPIPVVRPFTPDTTTELFKNYLQNGLCFRIQDDYATVEFIDKVITHYLKIYPSISLCDIDLMIDFRDINSNVNHLANSIQAITSNLPQISQICKLIISGGSFPVNLAKFAKDTVSSIDRSEWTLWQRVKKAIPTSIDLIYSDYGNVHPIYDPDIEQRPGSCSIKYTDDERFIIFKGVRAQDSPISTKQYQEKAKDLITRPFYSGRTFCWGDQFIEDCANGSVTPGNPATWVKVTQNHHFAKILQIL